MPAEESFDLQEARRMLDEDHRGLEKASWLLIWTVSGGLGPFLLEDVRSHVNGSLDSDAMARKRMRSKQTSEVSCHDRPSGLSFGPRQDVDAVVKELEAAGFGRERPVMDMGCAYHDFSKGLLRVDLDLQSFPAVLALIEGSMESMSCRHRGVRGLNVIARHYEGPSEEEILHDPLLVMTLLRSLDICICRLERLATIGPTAYLRVEEEPRGTFRRVLSLTWRWLRPSFLRWCELEHSLNRREQVCWLQRFICVGHSAGIDQEVLEQFLTRWMPVCSVLRGDPLPVPKTTKTKVRLPELLMQRLERRTNDRALSTVFAPLVAVLYPKQQMTIAQLENALAEQQREMHMLVAHHYETARQMLVSRDQMATACQIENQELRAQIGELRKQTSLPAKRQRDQALLARQHMQANKVLLKRDLEARKTEEENAQLRSTLAQLKSKPPKATQFSTSDDEMTENPESDDNSPVSRSQVSPTKIRVPDESRR
eukprot:g31531.t1